MLEPHNADKQHSDISSLNTIMSLAMNFKGVRGIINYYNVMGRDMAVNIYIKDELPVKILTAPRSRAMSS